MILLYHLLRNYLPIHTPCSSMFNPSSHELLFFEGGGEGNRYCTERGMNDMHVFDPLHVHGFSIHGLLTHAHVDSLDNQCLKIRLLYPHHSPSI